jgi:hypothetical protein
LGILFGSPYGLIGDGIWESELVLPTDSDPVSRQCLGYETAHPELTALCQKLRLSQFLWDDFCGTNKVHQVTKVQRVLI